MLASLAAGILVALGLVAASIALDPHPIKDAHGGIQLTPGLAIGQLLTYLPIVAAVLPLLPYVAMRGYAEIGLRGIRPRDLGIAIAGAAAMFAVTGIVSAIQNLIVHSASKQLAVELFGTTHDRLLIGLLAAIAVIFAPFTEELVFRGVVFNALLRYLPAVAAIAIDGIFFGLLHFDKNASVPLMFGGMVLAFIYYRTGSLTTSMLTHATFNLTSVILVLTIGDKIT